MEIKRFSVKKKTVTVYPGSNDSPVVYFNTYKEQGDEVWRLIKNNGISLVTITDLDWNHDMSPWQSPTVIKGDKPFSGGADEYLDFMLREIIPRAEEILDGVSERGIAGYSMAGMFAVYALYNTDIFSEAASVSGSLWFPGFKEYVFSHELKSQPRKMYFSLGDAESNSKNQYLRTVLESTKAIEEFYRKKGIETTFKLNKGGHFTDVSKRSADGITSIYK